MVARHLAMAAELIDEDPELAHQHAISAARRAGRIAVVRETLAITAYATGDFALALRELRTYRRISGSDDQIALMVDSERGVGRPDRALEVGRAVDRSDARRRRCGSNSRSRCRARASTSASRSARSHELDIPRARSGSGVRVEPRRCSPPAPTVLEELGRDDEAEEWQRRAESRRGARRRRVGARSRGRTRGDDDLEDGGSTMTTRRSVERGRRRRRRSGRRGRRAGRADDADDPEPARGRRRGELRRDADVDEPTRRGPLMALFRARTEPTPLDGVDVVLADLDGVVYAGAGALPYAVESLNRAATAARLGYITNNASRTDASVAGAPERAGARRRAGRRRDQSAGGDAAARRAHRAGRDRARRRRRRTRRTRSRRRASSSPAAPTTPGRRRAGLRPRGRLDAAGRGRVRARRLPEEEGGIPWIATNTDWTIPQARGIAPGNGTLVSAVHTAVGRLATVAGKPEVPIFEEAVARFGAQHPLFLGDRLDTDILGANRAGIPSALVLTGHRPSEARARGARRIAADVHPRRPARAARAVPRGAVARRRRHGPRRDGAHRRAGRADPRRRATGRSTCCAPARRRSGTPGARSTASACPSGSTRIRSTARERVGARSGDAATVS